MTGPASSGADPAFLLGAVIRLTLALILAEAAWHALRDPSGHRAIVGQYRLLPRMLVPAAALGLPILSLLAAAALPIPSLARLGIGLALGLMLLFTAAIAINLARGRVAIDCGCGGGAGHALSPGLVVRNLLLTGLLLLAAAVPARGPLDAGFWLAVPGAALALSGLYFAGGQLLANAQAFRRGATGSGA